MKNLGLILFLSSFVLIQMGFTKMIETLILFFIFRIGVFYYQRKYPEIAEINDDSSSTSSCFSFGFKKPKIDLRFKYPSWQMPYEQRQTPYEQRQTPYEQRQTPYEQRKTPYEQRQAPFEQRQTSFMQMPQDQGKKAINFNAFLTPRVANKV